MPSIMTNRAIRVIENGTGCIHCGILLPLLPSLIVAHLETHLPTLPTPPHPPTQDTP